MRVPDPVVATVTDSESVAEGREAVVKVFRGPGCEGRAAGFIGTLPGHARGRYGLDIGHCAPCGAHYEAGDPASDPKRCGACGAPYGAE